MVGGPFDSLPDELKQRFVAVFYDNLADACSGAATHIAIGTSDQAARQLIRVLEIADNPSAMQVIQDVVHELQRGARCHE
jgi:hypothetical protein